MHAALRAHGRGTTTRLALLAAALGACLLGAGEARAASWLPVPGPDLLLPAATPEDFPTFVSGEVVVRFADTASAARRASALRAADATVEHALPLPGVRVLALPAGASVADAVADLRAQSGVQWAEPNYIYHADATPNDPLYGSLYGLNQASDADIDAPEAWDLTTGSPSVTVGVVDTGVALDHPDLVANLVAGQDFVGAGDADPSDEEGHGTHVAGTIAAVGNNGVGMTGVSWGSKVMPLRALDANGSGTSTDIAEAFAYAGTHGVPIVNASLGGTSNSFAISSAIAASPNTLFVVAAGNDGVDNDLLPHFPCALAHVNVLCVAATDASDGTPSFSNWGASTVDVGAPGNAILSTSAFRPVSIFPDGFDTPLTGRWTTTGAWGISGGQLTDSPGGNYSGPTSSTATSSTFSVAGSSGCALRYRARWKIFAGADRFVVEASANGTTWTEISPGLADPYDGQTIEFAAGRMFSFEEPLTAVPGAIQVRFRLSVTSAGGEDGVYVDDVSVSCLTGAYPAGGSYEILSGTSMATPHVAGLAALVLSHQALTTAELKAAILGSVDPLPALAGRTVTGGRVNAARSLGFAFTPLVTTGSGTASALTGTVNPRGGQTAFFFDYGTSIAYTSRTPDASAGGGVVGAAVSAPLPKLLPGKTYHFRLNASNSAGPVNGLDASFTTPKDSGKPTSRTKKPACKKVKGKRRCTLSGTAADPATAVLGAGVKRVQVNLVRKAAGKCSVFNGKSFLKKKSCKSAEAVWAAAKLGAKGAWKLDLRVLAAGAYSVRTRAADVAGNTEKTFSKGRNKLSFTIR